ncbi:inner membrane complex protein 1i, putative [Plasmodium malariae]|uniref:Inner membrane complex protein 1i, putative n=1 Tax=Plasmodium malariae TaxID=5858 RepID=A0A1D3JLL5_PLAMA|nr:inner membrane complex protein 1i, putative [Plasmodium malariae]SBT87363.1 inner membrane complex protein 1i, putative [Plasmodium malariae]
MFHLYELLMFFLRQPRDAYEEEFLGPIFLQFYDKNYYRRDLIIKNRRGEKLKCSFFTPFNYNENTPCVIYTHSSSSCQLEVLDILHILLICECSVFSYDCAGCGLSDGYYSTKGWNEPQDLFLILNHLRNVEKIKNFALWGKYCGAVSSIIVASLDDNIKLLVIHCTSDTSSSYSTVYTGQSAPMMHMRTCILDSPYVSLVELYKTTFHLRAKRKREILFKNICLYFARRKIKRSFQYDINNVCPVFFIEDITIPTIYIFSKNDKIVNPAHSLYLAYKQQKAKKIIYISEKATQSYESFSYDSKLILAIRSVLCCSPYETDLSKTFDTNTYLKLFNELRDIYAYEFEFIDNLITKKMKKKNKIINSVKKFVCFKYQYKCSLNSSNFENEKCENYKDGKFNESRIANECEYLFADVDNIMEDSNDANFFKNQDINNLNSFSRTFDRTEQANERPFKILHMQSARSALKSKKNTYKKSLTWDSKLQSSITYFKEDCPFELLRNE